MDDGPYVALFSGGKDSFLALRRAQAAGHRVERLVTVDASPGSYLYHAPATAAIPYIARSLGLEATHLEAPAPQTDVSGDAARREIAPLAAYLDDRLADGDALAGLVTGAVASRYQYDRLSALCAERGLDLVAPLWGLEGTEVLAAMLEAELAVDVVAVAAEGLGRDWLGRRLDAEAVAELEALAETVGVHPAGEGGEFETLVVDAPAFSAPLSYEATTRWHGTHGALELTDVGLADRSA